MNEELKTEIPDEPRVSRRRRQQEDNTPKRTTVCPDCGSTDLIGDYERTAVWSLMKTSLIWVLNGGLSTMSKETSVQE